MSAVNLAGFLVKYCEKSVEMQQSGDDPDLLQAISTAAVALTEAAGKTYLNIIAIPSGKRSQVLQDGVNYHLGDDLSTYFGAIISKIIGGGYSILKCVSIRKEGRDSTPEFLIEQQRMQVCAGLAVSHVLAPLGPDMPGIFPAAPLGIAASLIDAKDVAARCLIPEDVQALNKLVHYFRRAKLAEAPENQRDEGSTRSLPLSLKIVDELGELCNIATQANSKDTDRMVARTNVLAYKSCANLYCMIVRQSSMKPLGNLCSGCELVRYCCAVCQKGDWKRGHKIACKSIQAAKE